MKRVPGDDTPHPSPAGTTGSSLTEAVERALEAGPAPNLERLEESRARVHAGLQVPQIEASSLDTSIEVYVRLNAVKKPPSTDLVFIIGTDVSPHPQGGMTFLQVDSHKWVLDSKKNEDGYKFLARLGNAIASAGYDVQLERSANLVGPVIARLRVRRKTSEP